MSWRKGEAMNNPSLTIRKTYDRHKKESPDSMISEKAIRTAVKTGDLPSVKIGNRVLISWETFEAWRRGELIHAH